MLAAPLPCPRFVPRLSQGPLRRVAGSGVQVRATPKQVNSFAVTERQAAEQPQVLASGEFPETGTAAQPNQIAQLLMEREEMLRELLEPGRLPPKASVVSTLRKEIADLREKLSQEIASTPGTMFNVPAAPRPADVISAAVNGARSGAAAPNGSILSSNGAAGSKPGQVSQGSASRVRAALRMVENKLAAEGSGEWQGSGSAAAGAGFSSYAYSSPSTWGENGGSSSSGVAEVASGWADSSSAQASAMAAVATTPEQLAMEVLEIENAKLRAQRDALLVRQAQLKEVMERQLSLKASAEMEAEVEAQPAV